MHSGNSKHACQPGTSQHDAPCRHATSAHPPGTGPMRVGKEVREHGNTTSRQRPDRTCSKQLQKAGTVKPASNGLCFLASGSRPYADTRGVMYAIHGLIRQCGDAIGSSSSCEVRAVSCQRFDWQACK